MAFEFGQFNFFSDPVIMGVAKAIQPGPYCGVFYQAMSAPVTALTTKEFEIYSREDNLRDGVLGASSWDDDDTTGLSVSAAAAKGLTIGHVLKIENEYVIVKAVDRSTNTISVWTRGAGGTTAAAHDAATPFKVVSFAGDDVDLKLVESANNTTTKYTNFIHTVFEVMEWTKHAELVGKGLDPANATVVLYSEHMTNVSRLLARSAIYGRKQRAESAAGRWMSAGLLQQLSDTNGGTRTVLKYNAAGAITDAKIKAALKEVFDRGGQPDTILCSTTNKAFLNNLLGACNIDEVMTSDRNQHTAGGIYANAYDYEGRKLNIVVDQDIPDDIIPIVKLSSCKKQWLTNDGLAVKDEPAGSSRESRKSIQGSLGYLIEDVGRDHTYLYGVDGGPSEKVHKIQIQGVGDGVSLPVAAGNPIPTYQQITVHADADVPAAAAANIGLRVLIGTAWTSGTKITTAVKDEVWASNGSAWIKQ
ncbi:MAG: hypothetical protein E7055_01750 [Lentisphaerae bacterium]|nr:hypothetical protein [Lentisphaerota bacterium]